MKYPRTLVFLLCLGLFSCAASQKKIEQAREKDPQYQYNIGLFYLNSSNLDEASKYFQKALALDPRHYQSLNMMGLVAAMRGNFQESVNFYKRSLAIAPDFSDAHNNLGTVYLELGNLDGAEEEFKKVIEDPNYTKKELPYCNLARLYIEKRDFDKARSCVDNAIRLNSRFALAFNLQGVIFENQDNVPAAIGSYQTAVRIVPDDVTFNFNLGAAYFKDDQWSKASEVFQKIVPRVTDAAMRDQISLYLKTIKEKEKGRP
jgi:type IV pilus assembly protein PilF